MSTDYNSPKVFISYAWENDALKQWVLDFSTDLRDNGIDVTLDQWSVVPGDRMPLFMEGAVKDNNFVLIICSEKYKQKSESRVGGVGYEGDIMTAEVLQNADNRKFIPVIRLGNMKSSIPSWLSGKYFLDFSDDTKYDSSFDDLMRTLLGLRKAAPPLGKIPEKYRVEMENAAIAKEKEAEENITLPSQTLPVASSARQITGAIPRLEADLIWHGGTRAPRGYSDKNPREKDINGDYVIMIGAGRKPIIHWELDWRFDLVLHNNSSIPAFNVSIKSIGRSHFRNLAKMPKVNNIKPLDSISLKADFAQRVESNHEVADAIMKFVIPEELEGLELEVTYQNEQREEFKTLVKVENNKLVNLLS
jgi:hypothetical protein